jgi:signal transduction histidine kinase
MYNRLTIFNISGWSLRKKILFALIGLLLISGLFKILITRIILLRFLKDEFKNKGVAVARGLAANSQVGILTWNIARLKELIENEKKSDNDIAYIFITDSSGSIIAHTFHKGFPVELAGVNNIENNRDFKVQLLDTQIGFIYDIAVPVFSEKSLLGLVRIGIMYSSVQKIVNTVNTIFISTTLFIVLIGIFLSYKISGMITKPVLQLVNAAKLIEKGDFSARISVLTQDEVGRLAAVFNEMASNLELLVREIKQVSIINERNRIAIEIHDGLLQSLTGIIRKVELCEKLFSIDSKRVMEELRQLKENSKLLLNKTRQVILDLKPFPDEGVNLSVLLLQFIKNFNKESQISVDLKIEKNFPDLPSQIKSSVFNIIREALTNVKKHSQAKTARVSLQIKERRLYVSIKDDGKGFELNKIQAEAVKQAKFGLHSMRERARMLGGIFNICTASGEGTVVSVDVPLDESEKTEDREQKTENRKPKTEIDD